MIFETDANRIAEEEAIDTIRYYLNSVPFMHGKAIIATCEKLTTQDFDVYYRGLRVGVGEVKCRDRDLAFFEKNGWAIEQEKLTALRTFEEDDMPVMLVLRTSDDQVLYVMMSTMLRHRKELRVEAGICRQSQSGGESSKLAVVIPGWMLTKAGRVGI